MSQCSWGSLSFPMQTSERLLAEITLSKKCLFCISGVFCLLFNKWGITKIYCAKKKNPRLLPCLFYPRLQIPPTPKLRELSIITCPKVPDGRGWGFANCWSINLLIDRIWKGRPRVKRTGPLRRGSDGKMATFFPGRSLRKTHFLYGQFQCLASNNPLYDTPLFSHSVRAICI